MATDTIQCPYCKREFPLSEAVSHQIREELRNEFAQQRTRQEKALAEREKQLAAAQKEIKTSKLALTDEVNRRLKQEKSKLLADARRQAESKIGVELEDLQSKLIQQSRKLAEAQKAELTLRRQRRELEEREKGLKLEVARKLDTERAKIRETVMRTAASEQRLRLGEKEKLISDLQKQIETLRQKAEQGSQQAQGEALELEFEEILRASFPDDEIKPVSAGTRGADILQKVRTSTGKDCGTIIWETKRTRGWQKSWITKLKEDQREHHAEIAVLLSMVLPPQVKNFAPMKGVWVTDFACAIGLAIALRQGLIGLTNARRTESGKKEKMEVLYTYLTSTEFRQSIEAIVEAFMSMKTDLDAEKRALAKQWARREKQIEQVVNTTAQMYGDMQGIVGQAALPGIKVLELQG